jgi:hypothetical protein
MLCSAADYAEGDEDWWGGEEEEEEEFFNHYKNDLERHAHTPSGVGRRQADHWFGDSCPRYHVTDTPSVANRGTCCSSRDEAYHQGMSAIVASSEPRGKVFKPAEISISRTNKQ